MSQSSQPRPSPDELLAAASAGDLDALQKLIVARHSILWRLVDAQLDARTRRWFDADDILQLTYIELFAGFTGCMFANLVALHAWLETAALHRLADCRRAARARKRDVRRQVGLGHTPRAMCDSSSFHDWVSRIASDEPTPSREIAREEARAALMMAIARLSEDHRTVVQLRVFQSRVAADVAAVMQRSEDAINQLMHRALTQLQRHMSAFSVSLSSF